MGIVDPLLIPLVVEDADLVAVLMARSLLLKVMSDRLHMCVDECLYSMHDLTCIGNGSLAGTMVDLIK